MPVRQAFDFSPVRRPLGRPAGKESPPRGKRRTRTRSARCPETRRGAKARTGERARPAQLGRPNARRGWPSYARRCRAPYTSTRQADRGRRCRAEASRIRTKKRRRPSAQAFEGSCGRRRTMDAGRGLTRWTRSAALPEWQRPRIELASRLTTSNRAQRVALVDLLVQCPGRTGLDPGGHGLQLRHGPRRAHRPPSALAISLLGSTHGRSAWPSRRSGWSRTRALCSPTSRLLP
jgi:hypothetical protein